MIFNTVCVHNTVEATPEPAMRIHWVMKNPSRLPQGNELTYFTFELANLDDDCLFLPSAFPYKPFNYACDGWSDGVTVHPDNCEYLLEELNVQHDFQGKAFLVLTAQFRPR